MWLNNALYGWYPYVALTIFLLGCLLRFDYSQYTWRSGSSQNRCSMCQSSGWAAIPSPKTSARAWVIAAAAGIPLPPVGRSRRGPEYDWKLAGGDE